METIKAVALELLDKLIEELESSASEHGCPRGSEQFIRNIEIEWRQRIEASSLKTEPAK